MKSFLCSNARSFIAVSAVWLSLGAQAADAAQIVVGQVAPLTGPEARQGRAYSAGMQIYFEAVNKEGGTNGHTFTLVRKDDRGQPSDTVALTRQLVAEAKPLVLAGYFGSRNISDLAASGLLKDERLVLVGYRSAEMQDETPMLYSVRANLRDELAQMTAHLATVGIKRLGLLYENSLNAQALVTAADTEAQKAGVTIITRASYAPNTTVVSEAASRFIQAKPQAILMVTSGAAAAAFIEAYRSLGGTAQLLGHSGTEIEQLSQRLSDEQMAGVIIAQVAPSPYQIKGRLTKEFSDTVKAQQPEVPLSFAMMEGYIAGRVIVEAVRRQGAKPTREGMASALHSMAPYDMGGYSVTFRPTQHTGSRYVELSIVSGLGKIRQ
ncbi:ABC transporter substrate-binding protein [Variovorax gossypii]|uniref:ABC transporter substrate-binding protein n=1 Tax=Variovorax gossypii TaxID=1679495 RepID=A0A3S0IFN4_9BURK|nr:MULTISPECIES: ABC transporter substrate-binding protein [Variovorax]MDR6522127.1 ABC-type branched-subunit amino acid transport system substrate-binding protein [Variovorax paradoxus]RTQ35573.1 ABC transporter substrate-binding protein [Variovorax gossypii]